MEPLTITNCEATAPGTISVTFSFSTAARARRAGLAALDLRPFLKIAEFKDGAPPGGHRTQLTTTNASISVDETPTPTSVSVLITLTQNVAGALTLTAGELIQVVFNNSGTDEILSPITLVKNGENVLKDIADNTGSTSQSIEDLAAFSLLTEEIGYSPSPLARPAGWGGAAAPAAGGTLGQIATKAISDVLGWQAKTDPKGFLCALNASVTLKEIDGHTEAVWTPRTYAIQTDLSGGITGAQASVYKRAKDALDQSLPLLDGLYPLFKEAKDEDVAALRATVRTQFTDLVGELGLLGGPRISRVTQLFSLLLGQKLPQKASDVLAFSLETDPDKISGSLGNLRVEFGFSIADDQVNTVQDEQDVTNFRIVSDYVTSLAQSWLNNLQFFGLQTQAPFFGTQLVLLTRQLSVIAESVNEVRFTLDSVFIGPADRQTLQINFRSPPASDNTPSMFLEELLSWVDTFASQEGPRLIEEGGKFGVAQSFVPIGTQLQTLVAGAVTPANADGLPRGYRSKRVRRSLEELRDQLQELVNLATPISHVITPEPQPALAVLGINPSAVFVSALPDRTTTLTIVGTGFTASGILTVEFFATLPSQVATHIGKGTPTVLTDNLAFVTLDLTDIVTTPGVTNDLGSYSVEIEMTQRPNVTATLRTGFTILP